MKRSTCSIALAAAVFLGLHGAANASEDPTILAARPDGGFLVIEGTHLVSGESPPLVILGDQSLLLVSFTATEIRAELPVPALGVGTYLLTVESKKNKEGTFWVVLGAPVPRTGQATDLDAGEDGDLQKGVPWPDPRFTDNADGTVNDHLTGLVWLKYLNCAPGRAIWTDALDAANNLADGQDCDGDGWPDLTDSSEPGEWRLPNVKELQSMIDYGEIEIMLPADHPFDVSAALDGVPFLQAFWSSTSHEGAFPIPGHDGKTLAYWVDFGTGSSGMDTKWGPGQYYVWHVRDAR